METLLQSVTIYGDPFCNLLQFMEIPSAICYNLLRSLLQSFTIYGEPFCNLLQFMEIPSAICYNLWRSLLQSVTNYEPPPAIRQICLINYFRNKSQLTVYNPLLYFWSLGKCLRSQDCLHCHIFWDAFKICPNLLRVHRVMQHQLLQ